jgi:hypothetical protein
MIQYPSNMEEPTITPKQLEILILLYRYRFLNRIQIQKFLNHKDPKRINTWLKDLTNKNIIGRKYSNRLKENTKPTIYHLATKSRKILLSQPNINEKLLKRVYRDKVRSIKLIEHCILVAKIYFYLQKQTKDQLHFFTKVDLSNHYYLPYNRPDAYIAIESEEETKRYFLKIIDDGTPRFMIRKKIAQYLEYFEEKTWQENTGYKNPSILIICPNEITKLFLNKYIAKIIDDEAEEEINFYLTTKEIIEYDQLTSNIWDKVEELGEN